MAQYEYKLDTSSSNMDNLEDIISAPPSGVRFRYHSVVRVAGDGLAVGDGYPQCEWQFIFLSWADIGTMLAFLGSDESASVYINTRRPDDTYETYSAIMHRPQVPEESRQAVGGWFDITFRFTHLEVV